MNCPRIHFTICKEKLFKQNLMNDKRKRAETKRKNFKFNANFNNSEVKLAAFDFQNFLDYYKELGYLKNIDFKDDFDENLSLKFNFGEINEENEKKFFEFKSEKNILNNVIIKKKFQPEKDEEEHHKKVNKFNIK